MTYSTTDKANIDKAKRRRHRSTAPLRRFPFLLLLFLCVAPTSCYLQQPHTTTTARARSVTSFDSLLYIANSFPEDDRTRRKGSPVRPEDVVDAAAAHHMIRTLRDDIRQQFARGHDSSYQVVQDAQDLTTRIELSSFSLSQQRQLCSLLDSFFQMITHKLFTSKRSSDVKNGLELLHFQWNHAEFVTPFRSIPQSILVQALNALATVLRQQAKHKQQQSTSSLLHSSSQEAFNILERLLVSGQGVRDRTAVADATFHRVLQAFCETQQMDLALRVVALRPSQPLSTVTYSILIKGYGNVQDLVHVQEWIQQATTNSNTTMMDTILLNTMVDAYISCRALSKAQHLFEETIVNKDALVQPNTRTYNILLKGLAQHHHNASFEEIQAWVSTMKKEGFWDAVSTNTFVHAALVHDKWAMAESILRKDTTTTVLDNNKRHQQHPNVQAYTELLDYHGRRHEMQKCLDLFKQMKQRNVEPNQVTYACLLRWLGVHGHFALARALLDEQTVHYSPKCFHALITGMLLRDNENTVDEQATISSDVRFRNALAVLQLMVDRKVKPMPTTIAAMIDALAQCNPSRTAEAQSLVTMLQHKHAVLATDCVVVNTALIKAHGNTHNITGALASFRRMTRPDAIAVNALLDACNRCNQGGLLVKLFAVHFDTTQSSLKPDVVSYSIVMSFFLKEHSVKSFQTAMQFYNDMKNRRNIHMDKAMVDMILKSFLRPQTVPKLRKVDIEFLSTVWKDAGSYLEWEDKQSLRRTRSLRAVLSDRILSVFGSHNNDLDALFPLEPDVLFEKKGWNTVDSGFQLWGNPPPSSPEDSFLRSKGWNDVDSSFRLI